MVGGGVPLAPQHGNHPRACRDEVHEACRRDEGEGGCHGEDHKSKEDRKEGEGDLRGRGKEDGRGEEVVVGEGGGEEGHDEEDEDHGEFHFRGEDRDEGHGEGEEDVQRWYRRIGAQSVASHLSQYAEHTERHHIA